MSILCFRKWGIQLPLGMQFFIPMGMDWTIPDPKVRKVIPAQPCFRSKRLIALCSGEVFPGCARLCPRLPRQGGFVLWILNGLRESFYKMRQQYKQDDQQAGKLDEAWKEQYAHCTRSQRSHWSFKTLSVFAAVVISPYDYSHSRWSQRIKRHLKNYWRPCSFPIYTFLCGASLLEV